MNEYYKPEYLGQVVTSFTGEFGQFHYTITQEDNTYKPIEVSEEGAATFGETEFGYVGLNVVDIEFGEDITDFIEDSVELAFGMADFWEYRMELGEEEYVQKMQEAWWDEEGVL